MNGISYPFFSTSFKILSILKFGFSVSASQDSYLNYSTVIQDSGIIISILDILPSYETITVNLDTAIAFNLLNYTDTMTFKSKLWGDLNGDYKRI